MKGPTLRALGRDALFQVLDNWVFRILAVVTLLPVLVTFVIGCREEGVVLLFGLKTWSYEGVLGALGGVATGVEDAQGLLIEVYLQQIFGWLVGIFGVLFCIAATAFFVPRMIEKGAADVLFHKPIGRLALYLSRYLAGLLFVGILSLVLVVGTYLGILLVSGYNDPGILLGAVTLTYLFGLVYAVSMLVGVVTRSTVAAVLLTVLFFGFNGCVHNAWITIAQLEASSEIELPATSGSDGEDEGEEVDESHGEGRGEERAGERAVDAERAHPVNRLLKRSLDIAHYLLPKTTDADYLAKKLRRAVDAPLYRDEESLVTVFRLPAGAERLAPSELSPELAPLAPPASADLLGEPVFGLRTPGAEPGLVHVLWRRPAETTETIRNGRTRVRRESSRNASERLEEAVAAVAVGGVQRDGGSFGSNAKGVPASATILRWNQEVGGRTRTRGAVVFRGTDWDWFYTLTIDADGELDDAAWEKAIREVDRAMGLDANVLRKTNWYEEKLGLDAEVPYNVFFSIGSSLAFTVAMLLLGWWRLTRIEF